MLTALLFWTYQRLEVPFLAPGHLLEIMSYLPCACREAFFLVTLQKWSSHDICRAVWGFVFVCFSLKKESSSASCTGLFRKALKENGFHQVAGLYMSPALHVFLPLLSSETISPDALWGYFAFFSSCVFFCFLSLLLSLFFVDMYALSFGVLGLFCFTSFSFFLLVFIFWTHLLVPRSLHATNYFH